jgi:hypothetical protein
LAGDIISLLVRDEGAFFYLEVESPKKVKAIKSPASRPAEQANPYIQEQLKSVIMNTEEQPCL